MRCQRKLKPPIFEKTMEGKLTVIHLEYILLIEIQMLSDLEDYWTRGSEDMLSWVKILFGIFSENRWHFKKNFEIILNNIFCS